MDAKEIVKAIIADPEAMRILANAVLDTPISSLCVATAAMTKPFSDCSLVPSNEAITAGHVNIDPR